MHAVMLSKKWALQKKRKQMKPDTINFGVIFSVNNLYTYNNVDASSNTKNYNTYDIKYFKLLQQFTVHVSEMRIKFTKNAG